MEQAIIEIETRLLSLAHDLTITYQPQEYYDRIEARIDELEDLRGSLNAL